MPLPDTLLRALTDEQLPLAPAAHFTDWTTVESEDAVQATPDFPALAKPWPLTIRAWSLSSEGLAQRVVDRWSPLSMPPAADGDLVHAHHEDTSAWVWESQSNSQRSFQPQPQAQPAPPGQAGGHWQPLPQQVEAVARQEEHDEPKLVGSAVSATTQVFQQEKQSQSHPPDIEQLARQIYPLIKQRLNLERERAGLRRR